MRTDSGDDMSVSSADDGGVEDGEVVFVSETVNAGGGSNTKNSNSGNNNHQQQGMTMTKSQKKNRRRKKSRAHKRKQLLRYPHLAPAEAAAAQPG